MLKKQKDECGEPEREGGWGEIDDLVIPLVEREVCGFETRNISIGNDPIERSEQRTLTRETHRDRHKVFEVLLETLDARASREAKVAGQALQKTAQ